MGSGGIT